MKICEKFEILPDLETKVEVKVAKMAEIFSRENLLKYSELIAKHFFLNNRNICQNGPKKAIWQRWNFRVRFDGTSIICLSRYKHSKC
jgi:hypothetical protein